MPGKAERLSLFVFIDALGWRLSRRYGFDEALLPVQAPLDTVLGYSCTCDPTIFTGRMPREHGHFSFFVYDPARSPFGLLGALRSAPALADRMRVRNRLSQVTARALGYTGYFHLYQTPFERLPYLDYTEKRDLYTEGAINGGQPTIFDHLRQAQVPFHLSDWRASERTNLAALHRALDHETPRFAYLYLASLDGVLHAEGTSGPSVGAAIGRYAAQLRELVQHAERRYQEVRLFVFSDHGMADVVETVDLLPRVEQLGLEYGRDYGAVYDSTLARFWFSSDRARERITALLASEPRGRVLADAELAGYGCDFPDRRYGELFFLLRPGALLVPSYMGLRPVAGMHGYAPEAPDSTASFLSNVRDTVVPRRIDGLFDLMRSEAGLGGARA